MRVERVLRSGARTCDNATVRTPVVAVPRGWGEPLGVDPAAELGAGCDVRVYDATDLTAPRSWADVVALIPGDLRVDADDMDRMPCLRVVSVDGTGVWSQVDVPAATARGIAVCNVRDYAAEAVAEFTIGAMIAVYRRIPQASRAVGSGRWSPDDFIGSGLRDRVLGLVGFGGIGARVAELAGAFGMRVICATAHPEKHRSESGDVAFVPLADLLDRCEVLSLHARLDEETRGLIGVAELARLRPGAILVNTARGGLIDEAALLGALRSGRLAGAALDVTDPEPLPKDSPLRRLESVLITPHIAAATREARLHATLACLSNVTAFLGGNPTSVVNAEGLAHR